MRLGLLRLGVVTGFTPGARTTLLVQGWLPVVVVWTMKEPGQDVAALVPETLALVTLIFPAEKLPKVAKTLFIAVVLAPVGMGGEVQPVPPDAPQPKQLF